MLSDPLATPFADILGEDRIFCVSPDKMAIAFAVLGVLFLSAVLVAACALMKSRRSGSGIPYYTRSMFSSSSSGGGSGYGGSKLLLQDGACAGPSCSSRTVPYGRVL